MSCKIILTPDLIILRHILMDVASHGFHGFCSDTVHLASFDVLETFLLAHPYQTHTARGGSKLGLKNVMVNMFIDICVNVKI